MTSRNPGLTRRAVLGGAAAGAGVLIAPTAALARSPAGDRVFTVRIGGLNGVSPVITPGRGFVLAGVQWATPDAAAIELRARTPGGSWSPWANASVRGHEPDRGTGPGALFGEPLWFGPSDQLQLRSARSVSGVRVHFVAATAVAGRLARADTTGPAAGAAAAVLAQPVLDAGPGQPPIVARSAWAGLGNGPSGGPFYGSIELAFVHHTENPNGYSAGEVPAMLLAIYDYHRYSRGYFDIAYNFIIDAFGRIWEGRAGGVDEPVIGAHAGGYNAISTGVALLGSFMFEQPSPAAVSALERLLAWKLSLHGVPALGKVRVQVEPSGAFYTPYAPGQRVLLPRIAGHRDGDLTSCPGSDLYGRLPAVRSQVSSLAGNPAQLSLLASGSTVPLSTPVTLNGKLTSMDGAPIAGAPLQVQTIAGIGVTTTVAAVTTAEDGSWSTTISLSRSAVVRAVHVDVPAVVSNLVVIGVVPALTLDLASTSPVRVSGTIAPSKRSVTISVYKLSGPHRRLVLTRKTAVRQGRFTARLSLGRRARGSYLILARTSADAISAAGASAPVSLTV